MFKIAQFDKSLELLTALDVKINWKAQNVFVIASKEDWEQKQKLHEYGFRHAQKQNIN